MSEDRKDEYTMPYYITRKAEFDINAYDFSEEYALSLIMKQLEDDNEEHGRVTVEEPEITFNYGCLRRDGKFYHDWIEVYIKQKVRSKKPVKTICHNYF